MKTWKSKLREEQDKFEAKEKRRIVEREKINRKMDEDVKAGKQARLIYTMKEETWWGYYE